MKLHFANKRTDTINISKIINDKNVKKKLPTQFNKIINFDSIYIN